MPRARRPLNVRNTVWDMAARVPDEAAVERAMEEIMPAINEAIQEQQNEQPTFNPEHIPADEIFEAPPMPEREVLLPVNPLYERQHTLGLHTPSVALIGCGGVGCWVALSLVLGGITELTLFDGDSISVHNLNRFPLPEAFVGELKSLALAKWLRTLRPKAEIQARGAYDPALHPLSNIEWIVCATDSLKSRLTCYESSKLIGSKYLEVGADGERWGLSPSPPEFSTELEGQAGYQTVPVHVGPCMMAGAAAAYYVLHDSEVIVSHTCDWAKGPIIQSKPNLGGLKFESMAEVDFKLLACPECGVELEASVIVLTKHIWDHHPHPEMTLREAKARAEHLLEQFHAVEPVVDEMGNAIGLDEVSYQEEVDHGQA